MNAERLKTAIAEYQRQLMHYTMKITANREAAADIVQESFLRLWKSESGKVAPELERAWLYRVCRNMAIDYVRRGRTHGGNRRHGQRLWPMKKKNRISKLERVLNAMDELSDSQKEVVRLKYQHDMAYKEIAAVTGMSVSNVGVTLHNAIKALKKHLAETAQTGESG